MCFKLRINAEKSALKAHGKSSVAPGYKTLFFAVQLSPALDRFDQLLGSFLDGPFPASFLFSSFLTVQILKKMFSSQLESNSDPRNRQQAC